MYVAIFAKIVRQIQISAEQFQVNKLMMAADKCGKKERKEERMENKQKGQKHYKKHLKSDVMIMTMIIRAH